ncbi:ribosome-associated translation inhibitor RaiA [Hyphomicrobium sp.]|uniref:ribosome hibernation-promoting factor, HPF/YfiA family n=1 Tax=Hyphomicrobium sp. TaxID=82 RepID=UPI000FA549DE|nr:ribosome-associated translation inhibitor RaiA [Hyphomicrobium sp.]RUO98290.1 MAG: ribosome-associated translation inhibitor RaiA [Hyphomicrobium sp.]
MTIQITGKNVEVGDAFQTYAGDKIRAVLHKYMAREVDGHIRLERERELFKTTCSVRLTNGLLLEAHGDGADAYGSVDSAAHKLETRIRRYKGRIKHHSSAAAARRKVDIAARDHVVSLSDVDEPPHDEANPLIIAEGQRNIGHMTVSEAVLQLDLSEAPFMIFKNAAHGGLNVVYRRNDGHIGWIDADLPIAAKPNGAATEKHAD